MNITTEPAALHPAGWETYQLQTAHTFLNAVLGDITPYTAVGTQHIIGTFAAQLNQIMTANRALVDLTGHDGPGDAMLAAREVLPRVHRAQQLLEALEGRNVTAADLQPLIAHLGAAMDRIEQVLGAAGYD